MLRLSIYVLWTAALVGTYSAEETSHTWEQYKKTYSKVYGSDAEESYRRGLWRSAVGFVSKHNKEADAGKHKYWLSANHFADHTDDEYESYMGTKIDPDYKPNYHPGHNATAQLPKHMDWREYGVVRGPKEQGRCNSCWAFSALAALQSAWAIKYNILPNLSEQNVIDCTTQGCNPSFYETAWDYIASTGPEKPVVGVDRYSVYPYTNATSNNGTVGRCTFKSAQSDIGATCKNYHYDIKDGSYDDFMETIAFIGPVSVSIDARSRKFGYYSHGVFPAKDCGQHIDHAVLLIGFSSDNSSGDYWLLENSWGTHWGEHGYFKFERKRGVNTCALLSYGAYPVL